MTDKEQPYFMEDESWYTVCDPWDSEDGRGYHLTDKAPKEAVESYDSFYSSINIEIEGRDYKVE